MDCLFCKIAAGEIPATVVYQDEKLLAFRDIAPVAPTHVVVIPKTHFPDAQLLSANDPALAGELLRVMAEIGEQEADTGYRMVFNTGDDGGQTVHHVHGHVLGGRHLKWPPG